MTTEKRVINISLSVEEWEKFNAALAETPYRSKREYARKLLLSDPVTIYYRNKSFDEFSNAYIGFKNQMNTLLAKDCLSEEERMWVMAEIWSIKQIVNSISDDVCKNAERH
jgi:hypothetical protein